MIKNGIKKTLVSEIKKALPDTNISVYFRKATSSAMYPHITFDISATNDYVNSDNIDIDIDVWGKNSNAPVDDIADKLEQYFNDRTFYENKNAFTLYKCSRGTIDDTDTTIVHELIRLTAICYEKGE